MTTDTAVLAPSTSHIKATGINKSYGGAQALIDVSIKIKRGTIHALVGENGAGKSTLGKIIGGAVKPDSGTIHLNGTPVSFTSPRDAIRGGIAVMDQELALVPTISVIDNVFLGVERSRGGIVSVAQQRQLFDEFAERIGFHRPSSATTGSLSIADQQKIAIMAAIARQAELIVMDEPTAALSRRETERLLTTIREFSASGMTVIYVSHFLDDVLAVADTITVLKDGHHVHTRPASAETHDSLVTAMLGRTLNLVFPEPTPPDRDAPVVMSVRGLSRPPDFHDINIDVHRGEIVGLVGLVGSGRTEIARAIFGADPAKGSVEIDGDKLTKRTPRASIRRGLVMLPESRKDQGLVMLRSVAENVALPHLSDLARRGILRRAHEREVVNDVLAKVDARTSSIDLPVSTMSGGNQQKVALAKWLVSTPRVLIADEPTRGVDVGAKMAIYSLLTGLAQNGIGILLISSELEEVLGLAHRLLVVRAGRLVAEIDADQADEESIMRLAFGADESQIP